MSTTATPGLLAARPTGNWSLIRRMLRLAWRARVACAYALLLRILLLVLVLGGLGFTGLGIDIVRHWHDPAVPRPVIAPFNANLPDDWGPMLQLFVVAGAILILALIRTALTYVSTVATADLVHRDIIVRLRGDVYDKLQRLSFRFFDANDSGSIINRVTGDTSRVGQFINGVLLQVVDLILTVSVALSYMLFIHVRLTLACLATMPVLAVLVVAFARVVKPGYRRNRELVDRLILTLSEYLQGVHVVKGFSREKEERRRFGADNAAVRDQACRIYWHVTTFQPVVGLLTQVNMMVLLLYGGYLVVQGELPLGTGLIVFAGLLQQFSTQINLLANITNTIQISLTGAQRVFEILDAPVEIQSPPGAVRIGKAKGHVRFENVSFAYRHGEPVLEGVDLDAMPGECVAILGATGAGKSTLLSLIPRFYDPAGGRILLDGHDLRDIDLDDLRRQIGLVFQENFLFSTTVAQNIAFGHPGATMEQIEKAARVAAAHDFIMELPQGYHTVLGEGGSDLSGGQRQRLAIARALLLEPSVLILDDATAAIDSQTEHEILQAMDNAMSGRTTFVVAHRLSTLRRAGKVVVLDRGRIVQAGTHDELMTAKGHYRRAARLQIADDVSRRLLGMPAGAE